MSAKLTKPQRQELARLAYERQSTYGKGRARVQNNLVSAGLARYGNVDGSPVRLSWADFCEITEAGRRALSSTPREGA